MTAHWLIIDDDPVFSTTLARSLTRRGDRVAVANDADTALVAATDAIDRVVLDLRLGNDSGLRLLPALRARLPLARIIILTGFGSIATAVQAVREGADDYLPKPTRLKDLLSAFEGAGGTPEEFPTMSPRRLEWEHIQRVLAEENGNFTQAARRLGMHRRTLQRKLSKKPAGQ
jgi:two-component system response regulator RegA